MGIEKKSPHAQRAELIRFERFELRPYSGELQCDGISTMLGRRTLKLLMALINARGRLVTIEDLLREVWEGLVVESNTLQARISMLRKALGQSRGLLKTYKGRGYALLADATIEIETEPHQATRASNRRNPDRLAFIGRTRELQELAELAATARCLSLVGPGGVGKTRLARELGRRLASSTGLQLCPVDLAPVTSAAVVLNVVAASVGVGATPNEDLLSAIVAALMERPRLMLFDNCEYLAAEIGELVTQLLQRIPDLLLLSTSQRSLGAAVEQVFRVEPLSLVRESTSPHSVSDAAALFLDRAKALDHGFSVNQARALVVDEICQRLDGVPLAIEMAVARIRILGLDELNDSLDMRLQLLRRSGGDADARYPTIRAMLDWNHGLLGPKEQALFRRLAIFPASFSLEAALSVGMHADGERWSYIDALSDLVDKSLVIVEPGEPPRYRILETLRLYGIEKLDGADERARTAELHAHYYRDLFDGIAEASEVTLPEIRSGFYRFELDNMRTAMAWALAHQSRVNTAVSLAGSTFNAWREFSFAEGRQYIDQALELIDASTPLALAARLFKQAGTVWYTSDEMRGLKMYELAAAAFRKIPDPANLAQMLSIIGYFYCQQNRLEDARAALNEALALVRGGKGKRLHELLTVSHLGMLHSDLQEPAVARGYFMEAKAIAAEIGDVVQEQVALANLSELEYRFGEIDTAIEIGDTVIEVVKTMSSGGLQPFLRALTTTIACYLILQSHNTKAAARLVEAMQLARQEGGVGITACVGLSAHFAIEQNAVWRASEILGFADARYVEGGGIRSPAEVAVYDSVRDRVRRQLSQEEIQAHAKAGAEWTEEYAITMANGYFANQHVAAPRQDQAASARN